MTPQTTTYIESISARDHDIQKKERRGLPFGVGNNVGRGSKDANRESRGLKMVLYEARNVRIIFKNENSLTQSCILCLARLLLKIRDHSLREDATSVTYPGEGIANVS